jgi:hypothetical protein
MNQQAIEVGSRIFYSGDMANAPGWFVVESATDYVIDRSLWFYNLREQGGERVFPGISARHIGHVYAGHCNPRFVTEQAVTTWRGQRLAELSAAVNGGAA